MEGPSSREVESQVSGIEKGGALLNVALAPQF